MRIEQGVAWVDLPGGEFRTATPGECATRIAELEARLAEVTHAYDVTFKRRTELELAILPFADAASRYDCEPGATIHDNVQLWQNGARIDFITVGDLRAARNVIK